MVSRNMINITALCLTTKGNKNLKLLSKCLESTSNP